MEREKRELFLFKKGNSEKQSGYYKMALGCSPFFDIL